MPEIAGLPEGIIHWIYKVVLFPQIHWIFMLFLIVVWLFFLTLPFWGRQSKTASKLRLNSPLGWLRMIVTLILFFNLGYLFSSAGWGEAEIAENARQIGDAISNTADSLSQIGR